MIHAQINKCRFIAWFVFVLFCMGGVVGLCNATETSVQNPSTGVLKLEGTDLDYLVLHRKDGHTERITPPGQIIELPPGEYRFEQVRLKGNYTCLNMGGARSDWVTVAADKPATLKVGGPLVPTIKVQRQGRILQLSYDLRGVGGETYMGGDRSKPPTFAVYRGQKKIASGKFEYG
ncbi:MAG: hypothetical protein JSW66_04535 [Phycisphaerales bacterium]|nr:MAG: hypothetical protein JSW66_04535 [Phycisphaerales bacterium]